MTDWWNERKIGLRKWGFKYKEFLKKKPKLMKGKVKAKQYAKKTSKDKYSLIMKGRRYKWKNKQSY